jgi:hypothetical protein
MNIHRAIQEIIDEHEQIYPKSCIASAIEIVLKALRKVDVYYYDVQNKWPNKDGKLTFANFKNMPIEGVTFKAKFTEYNIATAKSFPFDELFTTIDSELNNNRCVMISRPTKQGSHICVISRKQDGDFLFFTKASPKSDTDRATGKITIKDKITPCEIRKWRGTHILFYDSM